jgi:uracil-DNA glycosylase
MTQVGYEPETEDALRAEIAACTICASKLPLGPRPVVRFSRTAGVLIIGQAPGTRVHASGIPWDDQSGSRLRQWLGLSDLEFYDQEKVAIVPMGFCYPGKGKSGDLPPRPECAPAWHKRVFALLPRDRLTVLVGSYAQAAYLDAPRGSSMTDNIRNFRDFGPNVFPLPHPSWRSTGWMNRNPWFNESVLPTLRGVMRARFALLSG